MKKRCKWLTRHNWHTIPLYHSDLNEVVEYFIVCIKCGQSYTKEAK